MSLWHTIRKMHSDQVFTFLQKTGTLHGVAPATLGGLPTSRGIRREKEVLVQTVNHGRIIDGR